MSGYSNSLAGLRYLSISETTPGTAPIGGTFRLSFRGSITQDINTQLGASDIQDKLGLLDTIPDANGVTVTAVALGTSALLYKVTFISPDLAGNVEALQIVDVYNKITGSGAILNIFTDGQESAAQRGNAGVADASIAGNELSVVYDQLQRPHH